MRRLWTQDEKTCFLQEIAFTFPWEYAEWSKVVVGWGSGSTWILDTWKTRYECALDGSTLSGFYPGIILHPTKVTVVTFNLIELLYWSKSSLGSTSNSLQLVVIHALSDLSQKTESNDWIWSCVWGPLNSQTSWICLSLQGFISFACVIGNLLDYENAIMCSCRQSPTYVLMSPDVLHSLLTCHSTTNSSLIYMPWMLVELSRIKLDPSSLSIVKFMSVKI